MFDLLSVMPLGFFYFLLGVGNGQSFPPPLSAADEAKMFRAMKEEKDSDARKNLIEHNLRLVAHIVRKYYSSCKNQDDLVSIGCIGLIKAIDSFNTSNGARFATYAAKCIQNEILMYFRAQKKTGAEISINETIDVDRDGNPLTYIDVISAPDTIAEDLDRKTHIEKIYSLISKKLTGRERHIIVMRFGLDGNAPMTQKDVAEKLGISRSYVSRIEKAAIEKIKHELE